MKREMKSTARAALDLQALAVVRQMKKCSRQCPAFILCPLMPLAVQPKEPVKRECLVNCGDDRLKVAYYKMFVGGQDGVIQMLQSSILEYGELLRKSNDLTNKERLHSTERLNMMLERLHKMMSTREKKVGGGVKSSDEEMDEVILIASGNDAKPDPESLEHSPMLDELLKHEPTNPAAMPKMGIKEEWKEEVDLGKELLDKFFPQEE